MRDWLVNKLVRLIGRLWSGAAVQIWYGGQWHMWTRIEPLPAWMNIDAVVKMPGDKWTMTPEEAWNMIKEE